MERVLGGGARIRQLIALPKETGPDLLTSKSGGARPTPIEVGEDKLTVTVTARFELTQ